MNLTLNSDGYYYEVIEKSNWYLAKMYFHHKQGLTYSPKHWHQGLEVSCYINTDVTLILNGETMHFPKDTIVLVNRGVIHEIIPDSLKQPLGITLVFPYEFEKEYGLLTDSGYFSINPENPWNEPVKETLHNMIRYSEMETEDPFYYLAINGEIFKLLHLLCNHFFIKDANYYHMQKYWDRCKNILAFIDEEYSASLSLDRISEHFGMSKEYFSRLFKQYLGITYNTHLTNIRFYHAYMELMETSHSITDIALNNGFPDYRAFIRKFKQELGITPHQYRKLHSQNPESLFPFPQ